MKPALLATALLALPVVPDAQAQYLGRVARTDDCIFQGAISGIRVLSDRHMVLFGYSERDTYLIELAGTCFDQTQSSHLGTVDGDRNGRICGHGRDGISFVRFAHREECRIEAMERLSLGRREEILSGETGARPPRESREERRQRKEREKAEKEQARAEKEEREGRAGDDEAPPGGS